MSVWYTPAPPGVDTGPLRRRWMLGLWLQFGLQWLWFLPLALYKSDGGGDPDEGTAEGGLSALLLTPGRYRLERRGTREEWEAWADRAITDGIRKALRGAQEKADWNESGKYRYKYEPSAPTAFVRKRYYRGIGTAGAAALAARRGWDVDWGRTTRSEVRIVLRQQPGA